MPFFSKSVDKRSRNSMISFLENHARHGIGNDYQGSYAHNVKIRNLRLGDLADKAYELIQLDKTWWSLQQTICYVFRYLSRRTAFYPTVIRRDLENVFL